MKALRSKRGFTLVEMVVVVAIIAIMLGILIPVMTNTSSHQKTVRSYAKSFYYSVQELVTEEKLAKPSVNPFTGSEKYAVISVDIVFNMSENIAQSTIKTGSGGNGNALSGAPMSEIAADGALAEFASSLSKLMRTMERDGTYYAVVDKNYRVVSAYYSYGTAAQLDAYRSTGGQLTFTDDCLIGEYYTGAFPVDCCEKLDIMFSEAT